MVSYAHQKSVPCTQYAGVTGVFVHLVTDQSTDQPGAIFPWDRHARHLSNNLRLEPWSSV